MFYAVLGLLQTIGTIPSKHTGVIALFDEQFVKKGVFDKTMSRALHRAFEFRQKSDYRVVQDLTDKQTEEILNGAVNFVGEMKRYLKEQGFISD